MIREYKTVEEIVSPLMMVRMVENVTYDELVEVELHDGSIRRGKVLEVNGDTAVVQLFESTPCSWASPAICWAACSTAWASLLTAALTSFPRSTGISTACP